MQTIAHHAKILVFSLLIVVGAFSGTENAQALTFEMVPTINTDGTIENFNFPDTRPLEGVRMWYSENPIEYGEGTLITNVVNSTFSLNFIVLNPQEAVCGSYTTCVATTSGYYVVAYAKGSGLGNQPNWTVDGEQIYYKTRIVGGEHTNLFNFSTLSPTYQTRFTNIEVTGDIPVDPDTLPDITFDIDAFVEQSEINQNLASRNISYFQVRISPRPSTTTISQIVNVNQNEDPVTGQILFPDLEDGTYDYNVRFANFGCLSSLTECPFPFATINGEFIVTNGELVDGSVKTEFINAQQVVNLETPYEDCSITNISACINNSFRFLFIPSSNSIQNLVQLKDIIETRAPFSYGFDMVNVLEELTTTASAQTLDVELDLGFGTIPFINETMIQNAPYASTIKQLIEYLLWISFAFAMYRMSLTIHNKET